MLGDDKSSSLTKVEKKHGNRARKSNLDRLVQARVSSEEKELFRALAQSYGVKEASLHRRLIRTAIELGPSLFDDGQDDIRVLEHEIRKVGRNMNVIARGVNQGQIVLDGPTRDELKMVLHVLTGVTNVLEIQREKSDLYKSRVAY